MPLSDSTEHSTQLTDQSRFLAGRRVSKYVKDARLHAVEDCDGELRPLCDDSFKTDARDGEAVPFVPGDDPNHTCARCSQVVCHLRAAEGRWVVWAVHQPTGRVAGAVGRDTVAHHLSGGSMVALCGASAVGRTGKVRIEYAASSIDKCCAKCAKAL